MTKPNRFTGTFERCPRVLLVDQDPQTRALLGFGLLADGSELISRTLGLDIYDCICGDDGVRPDVVMIVDRGNDPSLEHMTGLCREAGVPVVVVTAFREGPVVEWAARLGSALMAAPLDMANVRATVRRLTDGDRLVRAEDKAT
jgi:AmiR/NasT family two-component response regulator